MTSEGHCDGGCDCGQCVWPNMAVLGIVACGLKDAQKWEKEGCGGG